VIWRYRTLEDFRAECPGGDPALQTAIVERLDDAIGWLESLGAPVVWEETGNARTVGKRFDPSALTDALARAAGEIRLGSTMRHVPGSDPGTCAERPVVLATGGFPARFARERGLLRRANRWSEGDGLELGQALGAATTGGMEEFYGRNMPAPPARIREQDYVPLAQLYGRYALVLNERGEEFAPEPLSWSEADLVQATARQPNARAWYVVGDEALEQRVRDRTVREMVESARAAGGSVVQPEELPFPTPPWARVAVYVMPGVTQTLGGLRIDERARVLDGDGTAIEGLYAAGADVGGISLGGYSSGLAAALVFGLAAGEAVS
jgi:succinate dehydrogenase/fumarate reductase flavoprotein subunit